MKHRSKSMRSVPVAPNTERHVLEPRNQVVVLTHHSGETVTKKSVFSTAGRWGR